MVFELNTRHGGNFDSAMIHRRAEVAFEQPLSKAAAFIWRRAKSSIRKPRRIRREELPADRLRIFESRLIESRAKSLPIPTLPYAPSKPGEPPRTPTGIFRQTIVFAVDTDRSTAVIGPTLLNGRGGRHVPSVLEFGGETEVRGRKVQIEARPYMGPSLRAEVSEMPSLFEGIL